MQLKAKAMQVRGNYENEFEEEEELKEDEDVGDGEMMMGANDNQEN